MENPVAGDDGVPKCLAGRRDTSELTENRPALQDSAKIDTGPRFERMVERVHSLGPRSLAELLTEIATATGEPGLIADRIKAYADLDPAVLRAVGADSFPP